MSGSLGPKGRWKVTQTAHGQLRLPRASSPEGRKERLELRRKHHEAMQALPYTNKAAHFYQKAPGS